jgi:hypothetical protein
VENVSLVKKVYGINTYSKVIDTSFSELITPQTTVSASVLTVDQFFREYDRLFFDIPVTGNSNSHTYLVERSQQYIGGSVIDAEKQALIEEINSLRQQLLDVNVSFNSISKLV